MAQSKNDQSETQQPSPQAERVPAGPVHLSIRTVGDQPVTRCGVEYGPKARTVTLLSGSSAWHLLRADPALKVTKAAAPKAPAKAASDDSSPAGESDAAQS
ncbi:hypothetical protein QO259_10415 [Salinicola sp. JS01]|uniref:hypothetical protein n=1 Tax=Salinicola sp. JS01 TaxID=3050071 RepID=UPI00255C07EC|nr:hypothetical protein [Salinicola sp. JS01]WIX31248.1 hypothetical protein QO259_10415 [Salinicola sp. JS01]